MYSKIYGGSPEDVIFVSWGQLVSHAWQTAGGFGKSTLPAGFELAVINDVTRWTAPLFARAVAQLTSLACAEIANPFERMNVSAAATPARFPVPRSDCAMIGRLTFRLEQFVEARVDAYKNLACSLMTTFHLSDCAELRSFGRVVRIDSLGDAHLAGESVRRVFFSSGKALIYKPRNSETEKVLHSTLTEWGGDANIFPKSLTSEQDCSWWREMTATPSGGFADSDLREIAEQYGYTLGMATVFAYEDLHRENVLLIKKPYKAVIVDSETVWSACLPKDPKGLSGFHPITWLGLATGMIPNPRIRNGLISEYSPIVNLLLRGEKKELDIWNSARLTGFVDPRAYAEHSPEWFKTLSDGVCTGLERACGLTRQAIERRGREFLSALSQLQIRFVYRPTRIYFEYLRDAISREVLDESSWKDSLWSMIYDQSINQSLHPTLHQAICEREMTFLESGCIPFFSCHDISMLSDHSNNDATWRGGFAEIGSHANTIDSIDGWKQLQNVFRSSLLNLETAIAIPVTPDKVPATRRKIKVPVDENILLLRNAVEDIMARSIHLKGGQIGFVDFAPSGTGNEQWSQPVGRGLYRGSAGIGLALWATSSLGRSDCIQVDYKPLFADISRQIEGGEITEIAVEDGWSFSSGAFGIAYALSVINRDRAAVLKIQRAFENSLTKVDMLNEWEEWDYLNGAAGALACYAAICEKSGQRSAMKLEEIIVDHIERLFPKILSLCGTDFFRTNRGLAHGPAGLVYGLGRARQLWNSKRIDHLFKRSVNLFLNELEEGRDKYWTNGGTWCGGATGVMRAFRRLGSASPILPDNYLASRHISTGSLRHVCCGSIGNFLLNLELNESQNSFEVGLASSERFVEDVVKHGALKVKQLKCIGFFQGISGIMYYSAHMLRGAPAISIEMID